MSHVPTGSTTRVDEIGAGIYRISTPIPPAAIPIPGGFTFNQYLIVDEQPLLFHTGPRKVFAATREAVARVLPPERLRWISFSHFEADECGALNEWLAVAPEAAPLVGPLLTAISVSDFSDRAPRTIGDGEIVSLGQKSVTWFETPHLPHSWECGYLGEISTRTLLCGDLFTQPGADVPPITEGDILGPSEAMRQAMDYFSHGRETRAQLERFAAFGPTTLACMHGSAWKGDGAKLLRALADAVADR
jgi:flavorubredoxin